MDSNWPDPDRRNTSAKNRVGLKGAMSCGSGVPCDALFGVQDSISSSSFHSRSHPLQNQRNVVKPSSEHCRITDQILPGPESFTDAWASGFGN